MQYGKEKSKHVPLDVRKERYEQIKAAADSAGQPVNAYIKQAVRTRMKSEVLTGRRNDRSNARLLSALNN